MMKKKNIKEALITSFLLLFLLTNVHAQPELNKIGKFFKNGNRTELIVLTDSENPITDTSCRKLVSEQKIHENVLNCRYHFEDVPKEGQWYKDFVFFKATTPTDFFLQKYQRRGLYDVVNRCYFTNPNRIDGTQYVHMIDHYNPNSVPITGFAFYTPDNQDFQIACYDSIYDLWMKICSMVDKDEKTYLLFKDENDPSVNPLNIYRFTNTDFINEDIPDVNVDTTANYLFLQRNYKLGQTYNTVIFPVDVPVYDYHHVYNGGANQMLIYRLDAIGDNSLNFVRDVSGILKANTPYIIKSQKNDNTQPDDILPEYYLSETPVDKYNINAIYKVLSENGIDVYAQYKKDAMQEKDYISPDEDIFIISNNKLVNCRQIDRAIVKRFRWYIKRPRTQNPQPITIYFDGVTEIDDVEYEAPNTDTIYDLNGVARCKMNEINSLKKGYYIVNGKVRLIGD